MFAFILQPHPAITSLLDAQADLIMPTDSLPSLCPPVPFLAPMQGGNFVSTGLNFTPLLAAIILHTRECFLFCKLHIGGMFSFM